MTIELPKTGWWTVGTDDGTLEGETAPDYWYGLTGNAAQRSFPRMSEEYLRTMTAKLDLKVRDGHGAFVLRDHSLRSWFLFFIKELESRGLHYAY